MHDTAWFETNGIPAIFIASDEFEHAAQKQAEMLGFSQVRRVFVKHPIQDQTDDEMRDRAELIFDELIRELLRPSNG